MKELSLNILDITKNSVTAGADRIEISLTLADNGWLEFKLTDNGCGMSEEVCKRVTDPFTPPERPERSEWGFRFSSSRQSRPAAI